jgi:hypothetical protein
MRPKSAAGACLWLACAPVAVVPIVVVLSGCAIASPECSGTVKVAPPAPSPAELSIAQSSPQIAALAQRYEPTVKMSIYDRFWPVSVATSLRARDASGRGVRLFSGDQVVADPVTLANLTPSGKPTDYLEYPARLADKVAQMRVFLRGLGVPESTIAAWPHDLFAVAERTAQIYFYDAGTGCTYAGRNSTRAYRALQYWFFYPLNYYPMTVDTQTMLADPLAADTADVDFHEGDWEHVTVLLEPQGTTFVPRYVWMARHAAEGRLVPWSTIQHDAAGHPVVYPAFGGHPSYPSCGAHGRALLAASVFDYVVCDPGLYTFSATNTRLVDLARVSWSCWPGHFGTTKGTSAGSNADDPTGQILVAGPPSPLRQAENKNVCPRASG